jgi:hypothetical protein
MNLYDVGNGTCGRGVEGDFPIVRSCEVVGTKTAHQRFLLMQFTCSFERNFMKLIHECNLSDTCTYFVNMSHMVTT